MRKKRPKTLLRTVILYGESYTLCKDVTILGPSALSDEVHKTTVLRKGSIVTFYKTDEHRLEDGLYFLFEVGEDVEINDDAVVQAEPGSVFNMRTLGEAMPPYTHTMFGIQFIRFPFDDEIEIYNKFAKVL